MNVRKILVPVDFSEGSREAMDAALALSKSMRGEVAIDLLHVWDAKTERLLPELTLRSDEKGTAQRLLQEVRAQSSGLQRAASFLGELEREGLKVEARMVHGPVVETILERAIDGAYDLVVMGTHGRKGVQRVLGSVAERVVRESLIPVLTVRMPASAASAANG
ncbi:MAG TPA: universal stress protein [bacterium]|nr:universal stress protein [bacterium]